MTQPHIECPLAPVKDEIHEGVVVFTVPEIFRRPLAEVFSKRSGLNNRLYPTPKEKHYFLRLQENDAAFTDLLARMRTVLGLPNAAILEFYSGWRYSVTSLARERELFDAEKARKKPQKEESEGMPLYTYLEHPREKNPLISYYLKQYLRERRRRKKKRTGPP